MGFKEQLPDRFEDIYVEHDCASWLFIWQSLYLFSLHTAVISHRVNERMMTFVAIKGMSTFLIVCHYYKSF